MRVVYLITFLLIAQVSFAQSQKKEKPEYPKEVALYNAKMYVAEHLIRNPADSFSYYRMVPLVEGKSAEMTTLYFQCPDKVMEGLLLGFFGDQMNEEGKRMRGSADFYYLPKDKALELLNKIEQIFEKQDDFLGDDKNENNVIFEYGDLTIVLYEGDGQTIRIFWNGFDSEWSYSDCKSTKKKLMKAME